MGDYSLHTLKDQATLYAAPVRFHRLKRQAELLVYSREHKKQEETDLEITSEAVPHLRLEPE